MIKPNHNLLAYLIQTISNGPTPISTREISKFVRKNSNLNRRNFTIGKFHISPTFQLKKFQVSLKEKL